MQSFINQATEAFIREIPKHAYPQTLILLPSKRAVYYFEQELIKQLSGAVWLPRCLAIQDFVSEVSGWSIYPPTELLLDFYQIYTETVPSDRQEPLDRFIQWAPEMLADFSEMDAYLVPHAQVFKEVADIKNLERWNPDGKEATDMQRAYLSLWDEMSELYNRVHQLFEDKKAGNSGATYRKAVEILEKSQNESFQAYSNYWWIGFNALNKCEEEIIQNLLIRNNLRLVWDIDNYYLKDHAQEAGLFLRRLLNKWPECNLEITSNGLTKTKEIHVYTGSGFDGMAFTAGQIIAERLPLENAENTALIPADEEGLLPTIFGLPKDLGTFNVTAGISMDASAVADWVIHLVRLLDDRKGASTVYHKRFWEFLEHTLTQHVFKFETSFIKSKTYRDIRKLAYVPKEDIEQVFQDVFPGELLEILTKSYKAINDIVFSSVRALHLLLDELSKNHSDESIFISEQVIGVSQAMEKLLSFIERPNLEWNTGSTLVFLRQLFSSESIQFVGEPLKGLQIMGMLESRVLDFERVILTSVNEGILPAGKTSGSFIPFDVKRAYGLPTFHEKDAIYAYHFYRLIQRAKEVHLIYNIETEGVKSAEESRFIKQLEFEWSNAEKGRVFVRKESSIPSDSGAPRIIQITKTNEVLEKLTNRLTQKGLSPSALNRYIASPLDFYLRYIIGLKEENEVSEILEDRDTGIILHELLEEYLRPYIGQNLNERTYDNLSKIYPEELERKLLSSLNLKSITGKNYLTLAYMKSFLSNFIAFEKKRFRETPIILIGVEVGEKTNKELIEFERVLEVDGVHIRISGAADRIELHNNTIRIIDYKSGVVEPSQLRVSSLNDLFTDVKKGKALQLFIYAWIYEPKLKDGQNLQSCIYSFPKPGSGLQYLAYDKSTEISFDVLREFEEELRAVIREILNSSIPLQNKPDATYTLFDMNA